MNNQTKINFERSPISPWLLLLPELHGEWMAYFHCMWYSSFFLAMCRFVKYNRAISEFSRRFLGADFQSFGHSTRSYNKQNIHYFMGYLENQEQHDLGEHQPGTTHCNQFGHDFLFWVALGENNESQQHLSSSLVTHKLVSSSEWLHKCKLDPAIFQQ